MLCSYKISALTSEQQVNFYCIYRNIKKHTYVFAATVSIYRNQPPDHLGGPALGLFQCINHFLAQGSPRLGTSSPDTVSLVPNRRERSLPQTCWPHIYSRSPGCRSLQPRLTPNAKTAADSCSAGCPSQPPELLPRLLASYPARISPIW